MDLITQLRTSILSQSLPFPSQPFLTSLVTARNPPPPLPSLLATAKARLLACDLTSVIVIDQSSPSLPQGLDDPSKENLRLTRDVHVQVVDVENLSLSRWEQVEELEAVERGETTRGREVIRVTDDAEQDPSSAQTQPQSRPAPPTAGKSATHRLTLQDCSGKRIFAIELRRIEKIGVGKTNMGEKILLKAGTVVARGNVLITPENCVVLGGKVDAWQRAWVEGRMARLKEAIGADRPR